MYANKLSQFNTQKELNDFILNFEIQVKSSNNIPEKISIEGTTLSGRESACAYYLAKGFNAKQIAAKLQLSHRTVETHLNNVKDKLGIRYKSELTEMLFNSGIFDAA